MGTWQMPLRLSPSIGTDIKSAAYFFDRIGYFHKRTCFHGGIKLSVFVSDNQYRTVGFANYFFGNAADEHVRNACSAVAAHYNHIHIFLFCLSDDFHKGFALPYHGCNFKGVFDWFV